MSIFNQYVFGHLNDDGTIEYFRPYNGGLKVTGTRRGKVVTSIILNPTEADMNNAGWYRVINVEEDGKDYQVGNVIYHYIGVHVAPDEEIIED